MGVLEYNVMNLGNKMVKSNRMAYPIEPPVLLDIPTYEGSGQCVHPSVVRIYGGWNGYEYWMAITPYPHNQSAYENPSIFASNDGITWVVPEGLTNPVVAQPGTGWNADTILIYDGTKLIMYYSQYGITPDKTYRVTSTNGITWTAPVVCTGSAGASLTNGGIVRVSATKWFATPSQGDRTTHLRYISTDGIAWQLDRKAQHNINGTLGHGTIYADGSGYHFLLGASGRDGQLDQSLYYGFSIDGIHIAYDPVPLIIPEKNTWYSKLIYTSCIVPYDNQQYIVYMSAMDTNFDWHLGYFKVNLNIGFDYLKIPMKPITDRILLQGLAVRDTDYHYSGGSQIPITEFNEYINKAIYVYSSLNQACDISIIDATQTAENIMFVNGTAGTDAQKYTIPANMTYTPQMFDKSKMAILGMPFGGAVYIGIKCTIAPTAGIITIRIIGWN